MKELKSVSLNDGKIEFEAEFDNGKLQHLLVFVDYDKTEEGKISLNTGKIMPEDVSSLVEWLVTTVMDGVTTELPVTSTEITKAQRNNPPKLRGPSLEDRKAVSTMPNKSDLTPLELEDLELAKLDGSPAVLSSQPVDPVKFTIPKGK